MKIKKCSWCGKERKVLIEEGASFNRTRIRLCPPCYANLEKREGKGRIWDKARAKALKRARKEQKYF